MTRYKDNGSNAPIDTRPSEYKGLKPPAITPQPKEDKDNDQSRKRSRKEKTESSSRT